MAILVKSEDIKKFWLNVDLDGEAWARETNTPIGE